MEPMKKYRDQIQKRANWLCGFRRNSTLIQSHLHHGCVITGTCFNKDQAIILRLPRRTCWTKHSTCQGFTWSLKDSYTRIAQNFKLTFTLPCYWDGKCGTSTPTSPGLTSDTWTWPESIPTLVRLKTGSKSHICEMLRCLWWCEK